jgi:hypothetical protein
VSLGFAGFRVPADRCQLNGESQRSAACLCFCGATIATVDEAHPQRSPRRRCLDQRRSAQISAFYCGQSL